MLKRVTFLTAAVSLTLLLAGCGGTLGPAPERGEIRFEAGSLLLRDDATKAALSNPTHIGVFAYLQTGTALSPGTWNSSRTPNFMFNTDVDFDGSTYSYSPTRFWPSSENTLSFWAYCPREDSPVLYQAGTSTTFTSSSAGIPDIQFTVTDGQTDFIVSGLVENQTYASNSGLVTLPFNHTLSLIDVNVYQTTSTLATYTVTLREVRFDGIYMTAILGSSGWRAWSGSRSSLSVWTGSTELVASPGTPLPGIMPLPQDLSNASALLHIEFDISYTDAEDVVHVVPNARNIYLRTVFEDASSTWAQNTHYTLNIEIQPDEPIEFTVTWSDWGSDFNYHLTS